MLQKLSALQLLSGELSMQYHKVVEQVDTLLPLILIKAVVPGIMEFHTATYIHTD